MTAEPIIAAPMLAEISGLIWLIVFVVIAIVSSFFKKKGEGEDEWELPPELKPRRDDSSPVARPASSRWE